MSGIVCLKREGVYEKSEWGFCLGGEVVGLNIRFRCLYFIVYMLMNVLLRVFGENIGSI